MPMVPLKKKILNNKNLVIHYIHIEILHKKVSEVQC
jgi:hypothetical protein